MPSASPLPLPLIVPLGDSGLLVRFADSLSEPANAAALVFARLAVAAGLPGVSSWDMDRSCLDRGSGATIWQAVRSAPDNPIFIAWRILVPK